MGEHGPSTVILEKIPSAPRSMKLMSYAFGTCTWLWVMFHFKKDWHTWVHGHTYNWEQFHKAPTARK